MKNLVFVLVFLAPPPLKRYILRWFWGAAVGTGARIGWFSSVIGRSVTLGDYSEIRALSLIRCDGAVAIGAYSAVSNMVLAYGCASLYLGDHCYVGPQCLINVDADVSMGDLSALGPGCQLFTHASFLPFTEGYWAKLDGIKIGSRVWIAAGVFIQPGVEVGDHAFVNARSVLSKEVAPGQVVQGPSSPAVARIEHMKRRMTPKRVDAATRQMLERFADIVLRAGHGIEVEIPSPGQLRFRYRGRCYILFLVPSEHGNEVIPEPQSGTNWIVVSNRPSWTPPGRVKLLPILDLGAMRTERSKDPVHRELWTFLRRYFGVTFELG